MYKHVAPAVGDVRRPKRPLESTKRRTFADPGAQAMDDPGNGDLDGNLQNDFATATQPIGGPARVQMDQARGFDGAKSRWGEMGGNDYRLLPHENWSVERRGELKRIMPVKQGLTAETTF